MSNEINNPNQLERLNNFVVIFRTENGKVNIDVYFQDETTWFAQKLIAESEYDKFRVVQDRESVSDFDRLIKGNILK